MMNSLTNAFWREVIDHLPGIILLFRVDDKEEAHLIFVNGNIRDALGYTPEEFVLASETPGSVVANSIDELIDKIAALSHEPGKSRIAGHEKANPGSFRGIDNRGKVDRGSRNNFIDDEPDSGNTQRNNDPPDSLPGCRFYSKRAAECTFHFDYRIFKVKKSDYPFIAVSLRPENKNVKSGPDRNPEYSFFIAESPIMKSLLKKVDAVAGRQTHILFRGDSGTGKRTLAKQVMHSNVLSGITGIEWDLTGLSNSGQNDAVQKLCGSNDRDENRIPSPDMKTLLIVEICRLTSSNQNKLFNWLQQRSSAGQHTRILATSAIHLEEEVQKGEFSAGLYYFLGFDTILLPPLSQRQEDIRVLVDTWVSEASGYLGPGELNVPDHIMEKLLQHDWPGNFDELFRVLRKSLLASETGDFRLSMDEGSGIERSGRTENGALSDVQEILQFDEMNRRYLEKVLARTDGKIYGKNGAAELLGMKPTTLQSKLKKLGVR